ncbi:hypothetical protein [Halocynthiibacter namhaensis]|uniref:hypothetical protein n=1 Tax=Halocynthiibacter namhaensis TaxID=1290553 RepID=UPI0005790062|nr:hypothetical protein [Halocynthiibacter namhaensis]
MKKVKTTYAVAIAAAFTLSACQSSVPQIASSDACGASQFEHLVGGPSRATIGLDIADDSRHYGSEERVATNVPTRLNFIHSGTAFESVTDPSSTIIKVFCG